MLINTKINKTIPESKAVANNIGNKSYKNLKEIAIQTKLTNNRPGDNYEQEADQVADQVMHMPDSIGIQKTCSSCGDDELQMKPLYSTITPLVQKQPDEEDEELVQTSVNIQKQPEEEFSFGEPSEDEEKPIQASLIQRQVEEDEEEPVQAKHIIQRQTEEEGDESIQTKTNNSGSLTATSSLENSLNHTRGQGESLSDDTRSFMEGRFGADFSDVRVHTDSHSVQFNKQLNSQAFTKGSDIYFNSDKYFPGSSSGKHLLAHELTHVVQQTSDVNAKEQVSKFPIEEPESSPAPTDLSCPPASSTPSEAPYLTINFQQNSTGLTDTQRRYLQSVAQTWHANGSNARVRIDGYASAEGTADHNWRLSCSRANALANELITPSDGSLGIPPIMIELFANGETNRFSTTDYVPNRIANVILNIPGPVPPVADEEEEDQPKCGPDITSTLTSVLSTVGPFFYGLTRNQRWRSCMGLTLDGPVVGVLPIMAWDIRQLFLPNTGVLDPYYHRYGCGSPRDPGCDTDATRHKCETPATTCGNSVLVGGKCMLAGTANYVLWGKLCKLCHDEGFSWPVQLRWSFSRSGMQSLIRLWKTVDWDDPNPPIAMALSTYDGTFPTVGSAAENRGHCTRRCRSYAGRFTFIWEPYRSR